MNNRRIFLIKNLLYYETFSRYGIMHNEDTYYLINNFIFFYNFNNSIILFETVFEIKYRLDFRLFQLIDLFRLARLC